MRLAGIATVAVSVQVPLQRCLLLHHRPMHSVEDRRAGAVQESL